MPTLAIKTGIVLWGHYRGYGFWDVGGEPAQVYAWKDWPQELTESELNWIEWPMIDRAGKSDAIKPPPIPVPPKPQLIEIGDGTRPPGIFPPVTWVIFVAGIVFGVLLTLLLLGGL